MGAEQSIIVTIQLAIIAFVGITILSALPAPGPNEPFHQLAMNLRVEFSEMFVLAFSLLGGFGFTIIALLARLR